MTRASTFVRSLLVVGILMSGVSRVAAAPVTYSSLSLEVNNEPNDPTLIGGMAPGGGATDMADHITDVANAAPVVANFLGALSSFGTEAYEDIGAGSNGTLNFGATGITASNSFALVEPPPPNTFSLSGNALLGLIGETPNTILLSSPVTAFGTYIVDAGDADADTLSLLLQNTNNPSFSETVPIGIAGPTFDLDNIFYFGVTDANNPFDEVTLLGGNAADGLSFVDGLLLDNTTVGFAAVPEPSSLALVCCSVLAGLAFFVRRASARRGTAMLPDCGSC
jgi:hypothetical protein